MENIKAVAATAKPVEALKRILDAESVRSQFENTLKDNSGQFIASLIEIYSGDGKLQLCDAADVVRAALKAATLHLPINRELGFAYINAYNTNVRSADGTSTRKYVPTFIMGYKGYIQLALRTNQYRIINSDVVYEGEIQHRDKLSGIISFSDTRQSDRIVGYFAYLELISGFRAMRYMTVDEMARYAKRYGNVPTNATVQQLVLLANKPAEGKGLGWMGNFTDMALKTVIRQLLGKNGVLSTEMQTALASDCLSADAEGRDAEIAAEEVQVIEVEEPALSAPAKPKPEAGPKPAAEPTDMFGDVEYMPY